MKKQYSEPAARLICMEACEGVICASAQDLSQDKSLIEQFTENEFWI